MRVLVSCLANELNLYLRMCFIRTIYYYYPITYLYTDVDHVPDLLTYLYTDIDHVPDLLTYLYTDVIMSQIQ